MLKLHADVALDDFELRLAGASRAFVSTSGARLSGTAAVARQATAPPHTREVRAGVLWDRLSFLSVNQLLHCC
jgi:hypothetical protein